MRHIRLICIRRGVSYEEGEALAKENKMLFLEASAKFGQNVEQVRG
jgi:hypothetical protein